MKVDAHHQEFGYELLSAVPYAYDLHLKGKLTETKSNIGTSPLYYFSPKHTEVDELRTFWNTEKARRAGLPYTFIHRFERPELTFPPYKEVYKNSEFKWDKPTLVIANRYNREWDRPPINFFDLEILDWLFDNLKSQYEIVYFAVDLPDHIQDDCHNMDMDDRAICEKHGVKVFQDIKGDCWNTSLLKIFANCEHYITMNGGYAILASLFGGTNIIYSKRDPIQHASELKYNSFWRWYPNHSNQRTVPVETYEELKRKVQAVYIDKTPVVNIILRSSGRMNYFTRCFASIQKQDYENINVVITTDEQKGLIYSRAAKARHVSMLPVHPKNKPQGDEYGDLFLHNEYIDRVQKLVKGYILVLDDDNMLNTTNAVSIMAENAEQNKLLIWRCKFPNTVIPNGSFTKEVKLFNIDSACFLYHTDYIKFTDWSQWKRADYRTAKKLSGKLLPKWIDVVLTTVQHQANFGQRNDINVNLMENKFMKTVKLIQNVGGNNLGERKRLDNALAAKLVNEGKAVYIKDAVDELNRVTSPKPFEKPLPEENKALVVETETKRTRKPRTPKSTKK